MHTIYQMYYSQTHLILSSAKKTTKGTTLKISLEKHILKVTDETEYSLRWGSFVPFQTEGLYKNLVSVHVHKISNISKSTTLKRVIC